MRKLSTVNKLRAKHEIDNILFNYLLQEESHQERQLNSTFVSPPPTPTPIMDAGSPVFPPSQISHQSSNLPSISTFQNKVYHNLNQTGAVHGLSKKSYTGFISDESPGNDISVGDIFRKFRENKQ